MKSQIFPSLRSLLVAAVLWTPGGTALADLEVSATVQIHARADFEAPLAAHGTWVAVGSYGRCWRPAHLSVEWRPYSCGEWVWTDCGWYWSSDEPWGWACYHYGRWVFDPGEGWVWVPDVEWAPAWVSWRCGGGYIGWAPLPPAGLFVAHRPGPELFVFVGTARFGEPMRPSALIVKNSTVVNKTVEIGGVKRESRTLGATPQKVFVNSGPTVEMVQKGGGKSFKMVSVREAARATRGPSSLKHDSSEPGGKAAAHAGGNNGGGADGEIRSASGHGNSPAGSGGRRSQGGGGHGRGH